MRWLGLPLALMLCCGCSSESSTSIVRFTNWGGAGDDSDLARTVQAIHDEFRAQNPDVDLRVEGIPGSQEYVTKLLLSYVAGAEPDVITLDASSSAVFINNDVLMDLRPLAEGDPGFTWTDYFGNVVDMGSRDAAIYAVPMDFTPMVMYYNKRLFREAGVPEPKPGWSYADFRDAAVALTGGQGQFGFEFANWMPMWILFLWNNGGDVLNPDGTLASGSFDSPESVEAVRFLRDLVVRDRAAPSLSQMAAAGVDMFASGRAAMKISGHWYMTGLPAAKGIAMEDVGIAPVPSNLERSVTVMYESGLGIARRSKNPEAAWKFVKYMTSRDVQRRYNASGIAICARADVAKERATTEIERRFVSIVPSCRPPWGVRVEGYEVIESIGQKAMDAVLNHGADIRATLKSAAAEMDAELSRT